MKTFKCFIVAAAVVVLAFANTSEAQNSNAEETNHQQPLNNLRRGLIANVSTGVNIEGPINRSQLNRMRGIHHRHQQSNGNEGIYQPQQQPHEILRSRQDYINGNGQQILNNEDSRPGIRYSDTRSNSANNRQPIYFTEGQNEDYNVNPVQYTQFSRGSHGNRTNYSGNSERTNPLNGQSSGSQGASVSTNINIESLTKHNGQRHQQPQQSNNGRINHRQEQSNGISSLPQHYINAHGQRIVYYDDSRPNNEEWYTSYPQQFHNSGRRTSGHYPFQQTHSSRQRHGNNNSVRNPGNQNKYKTCGYESESHEQSGNISNRGNSDGSNNAGIHYYAHAHGTDGSSNFGVRNLQPVINGQSYQNGNNRYEQQISGNEGIYGVSGTQVQSPPVITSDKTSVSNNNPNRNVGNQGNSGNGQTTYIENLNQTPQIHNYGGTAPVAPRNDGQGSQTAPNANRNPDSSLTQVLSNTADNGIQNQGSQTPLPHPTSGTQGQSVTERASGTEAGGTNNLNRGLPTNENVSNQGNSGNGQTTYIENLNQTPQIHNYGGTAPVAPRNDGQGSQTAPNANRNPDSSLTQVLSNTADNGIQNQGSQTPLPHPTSGTQGQSVTERASGTEAGGTNNLNRGLSTNENVSNQGNSGNGQTTYIENLNQTPQIHNYGGTAPVAPRNDGQGSQTAPNANRNPDSSLTQVLSNTADNGIQNQGSQTPLPHPTSGTQGQSVTERASGTEAGGTNNLNRGLPTNENVSNQGNSGNGQTTYIENLNQTPQIHNYGGTAPVAPRNDGQGSQTAPNAYTNSSGNGVLSNTADNGIQNQGSQTPLPHPTSGTQGQSVTGTASGTEAGGTNNLNRGLPTNENVSNQGNSGNGQTTYIENLNQTPQIPTHGSTAPVAPRNDGQGSQTAPNANRNSDGIQNQGSQTPSPHLTLGAQAQSPTVSPNAGYIGTYNQNAMNQYGADNSGGYLPETRNPSSGNTFSGSDIVPRSQSAWNLGRQLQTPQSEVNNAGINNYAHAPIPNDYFTQFGYNGGFNQNLNNQYGQQNYLYNGQGANNGYLQDSTYYENSISSNAASTQSSQNHTEFSAKNSAIQSTGQTGKMAQYVSKQESSSSSDANSAQSSQAYNQTSVNYKSSQPMRSAETYPNGIGPVNSYYKNTLSSNAGSTQSSQNHNEFSAQNSAIQSTGQTGKMAQYVSKQESSSSSDANSAQSSQAYNQTLMRSTGNYPNGEGRVDSSYVNSLQNSSSFNNTSAQSSQSRTQSSSIQSNTPTGSYSNVRAPGVIHNRNNEEVIVRNPSGTPIHSSTGSAPLAQSNIAGNGNVNNLANQGQNTTPNAVATNDESVPQVHSPTRNGSSTQSIPTENGNASNLGNQGHVVPVPQVRSPTENEPSTQLIPTQNGNASNLGNPGHVEPVPQDRSPTGNGPSTQLIPTQNGNASHLGNPGQVVPVPQVHSPTRNGSSTQSIPTVTVPQVHSPTRNGSLPQAASTGRQTSVTPRPVSGTVVSSPAQRGSSAQPGNVPNPRLATGSRTTDNSNAVNGRQQGPTSGNGEQNRNAQGSGAHHNLGPLGRVGQYADSVLYHFGQTLGRDLNDQRNSLLGYGPNNDFDSRGRNTNGEQQRRPSSGFLGF